MVLHTGQDRTIWHFFRVLFPSTWRTLSPDTLFYQDLGYTQTPRICHTFVLSLLVSGRFLPQNAYFSWQARDCQIVPVLPSVHFLAGQRQKSEKLPHSCWPLVSGIVAQCTVTLAGVAARPTWGATPFERQLDARRPWQLTPDGCDRALQGHVSEVPKRGWREGVGDKQTPQKEAKMFSRNVSPLLLRVKKRGLNLWPFKDLLAPTPSVRQALFETSECSAMTLF